MLSVRSSVRPYVCPHFSNLAKTNQQKIMVATGTGSDRVDHWWHLSCSFLFRSRSVLCRLCSVGLQEPWFPIVQHCSYSSQLAIKGSINKRAVTRQFYLTYNFVKIKLRWDVAKIFLFRVIKEKEKINSCSLVGQTSFSSITSCYRVSLQFSF